jgi:hypothetical protein
MTNTSRLSVRVIPGFHRVVDEICAVLGCYAAYSGNSVPMFRDNLSVPSSRGKKIWPIGCPETSVQSQHSALRNIPEERRSHVVSSFAP